MIRTLPGYRRIGALPVTATAPPRATTASVAARQTSIAAATPASSGSDNISTALWGNTSYGVQTAQQNLVATISAQLAAQGINPATATQAQVMQAYQPTQTASLAQAYATLGTQIMAVTAPPARASVPVDAGVNYSAVEVPGNVTYTADLETVQNLLDLYSDTTDNSAAIVNQLYQQGTVPGTVTGAQALALTGIGAAAGTTAAASSLPSFLLTSSGTPNYWLIGGGILVAALFLRK